MTPYVDNKYEKFNQIEFNSSKKENSLTFREFLADGSYIELDQGSYGKGYNKTPKNSNYTIVKIYFQNGNIKSKGLTLNLPWTTFRKGIWYEFDESGKLIKETDYDKPFKFTFEDILAFCEKEKIQVDKGPILQSTGYHTTIQRGLENNHPWWTIEWLKQPDILETIKLDGISGKVISRKDRNYINN